MEISESVRRTLVEKYGFGSDMVDIAFRAGFKCEYCSTDLLASVDDYEWNWEREHVVPVSAGGVDRLDNWALSCRLCNQLKGHWDPSGEAGEGSGREELVAAARRFVQQQWAARQLELAEVRAFVARELTL